MPMKAPAANSSFDRLLRSSAYKSLDPHKKLDAMLEHKSFTQLLTDGDIFDVQGASDRSGYTPQHIRRLCREKRIAHIDRGPTPEEVVFFFLPEQLTALFRYQKAKA
jgi:hypothetical protein